MALVQSMQQAEHSLNRHEAKCMGLFRALPVFVFAALIAAAGPGLCQQAGWQDQLYASPKVPGREAFGLRDVARQAAKNKARNRSDDALLDREIAGIPIRGGKALLFQSHAESLDGADVVGLVDGKGAHLVIALPPGQ
jgi:hypothetical protein